MSCADRQKAPRGMSESLALRLRSLWTCERGATAIEYGLIASIITITLIVAVAATGNSVLVLFNYVEDEVQAALSGAWRTGD
jgi:Flp pilus assembly pilin Flp